MAFYSWHFLTDDLMRFRPFFSETRRSTSEQFSTRLLFLRSEWLIWACPLAEHMEMEDPRNRQACYQTIILSCSILADLPIYLFRVQVDFLSGMSDACFDGRCTYIITLNIHIPIEPKIGKVFSGQATFWWVKAFKPHIFWGHSSRSATRAAAPRWYYIQYMWSYVYIHIIYRTLL
jgi:hypothetical protein